MSLYEGVPHPPLLLKNNKSTDKINASVDVPRGDVILFAVEGDVYKTKSHMDTGVETTQKIVANGDTSMTVDVINEATENAGVTVENVLLKDNTVTASFVESATMEANFINQASVGAGVTVEDVKIAGGVVYTDVIESTDQLNPCVIEAVSLYDNTLTANLITANAAVTTNTIVERTSAFGVTIDGVLLKDGGVTCTGSVKTDTITENTSSVGTTVNGVLLSNSTVTAPNDVSTNGIYEYTTNAGVTVEGVLLKDGVVSNTDIDASTATLNSCTVATSLSTNTISERTSASGVTVDGVLLKDGLIQGNAFVETPYYCAMRLSGNQSLSAGVAALLDIDTVVVDPGSVADTSNSRMVIPNIGSASEGLWLVVVQLAMTSATVGSRTYVQLRKNGAAAQLEDRANSMTGEYMKFVFIERFSQGENMSLYVSHDNTATLTGGASYNATRVHMSLLHRYA